MAQYTAYHPIATDCIVNLGAISAKTLLDFEL